MAEDQLFGQMSDLDEDDDDNDDDDSQLPSTSDQADIMKEGDHTHNAIQKPF